MAEHWTRKNCLGISFRFFCNYFISEISAQTFPIAFFCEMTKYSVTCFWCLSMIVWGRARKNCFKSFQKQAEKKLRSAIFIIAAPRSHQILQKRPAYRLQSAKNKSAKIIGKSVQSYIHLMNRMWCEFSMRRQGSSFYNEFPEIMIQSFRRQKSWNSCRSPLNLWWSFFCLWLTDCSIFRSFVRSISELSGWKRKEVI